MCCVYSFAKISVEEEYILMWMVYTLMFFMFIGALVATVNLDHSGRKDFGIDFIRLVIFTTAFLAMFYMVK